MKSATGEQIQQFAELSGDTNPIHIDKEQASKSIFGERVIHGVYALGWVSAELADLYTDDTVILRGFESIEFHKPITLEEEVEISLSEVKLAETIDFTITNPETDEVKVTGTALITVV